MKKIFINILIMAMLVITHSWSQPVPSVFGDSSICSIGWGNGIFVAGGEDGKVSSSTDGVIWSEISNSTFGNSAIVSIGFGNNKFVAVGNDGKIATSQNGIIWTAVINNTFGTSNINDITFGNGLFVAVGDNNKIATSPDGINWTAVTNCPFSNDDKITCIAFGNKVFVISRWGRGNEIYAISSDGTNWTRVKTDLGPYGSAFISDISFGSYTFVAVGNTGADSGFIYTSHDGIEWEFTNFGIFGAQGFSIIATYWGGSDSYWWSNSRFVAVGSHGSLGISDYSGKNWVSIFTPDPYPNHRGSSNPNSIYAIIFGNDTFVGVGEKGRIIISPDGLSWTDISR